jgi:hypothetical protein
MKNPNIDGCLPHEMAPKCNKDVVGRIAALRLVTWKPRFSRPLPLKL